MLKKLILICLLLTGISSVAEEVPITITPVQKISTGNKHLMEGDILEFRDINTNEIITGIVKELRSRQAFEKPSVVNRKKMMKAVYVQKLHLNED